MFCSKILADNAYDASLVFSHDRACLPFKALFTWQGELLSKACHQHLTLSDLGTLPPKDSTILHLQKFCDLWEAAARAQQSSPGATPLLQKPRAVAFGVRAFGQIWRTKRSLRWWFLCPNEANGGQLAVDKRRLADDRQGLLGKRRGQRSTDCGELSPDESCGQRLASTCRRAFQAVGPVVPVQQAAPGGCAADQP